MKVITIEVEDDVHLRFKQWCLMQRISMTAEIRAHIVSKLQFTRDLDPGPIVDSGKSLQVGKVEFVKQGSELKPKSQPTENKGWSPPPGFKPYTTKSKV